MAKVNDLIKIMRGIAPEHLCWTKTPDNVGFTLGDASSPVTDVLITLDVSNQAVALAKKNKCQMIITHHPLIPAAIKNIRADTVLGNKLMQLINAGISVYSAHTNLDFVNGGLNEYAALALGLTNLRPMEPYISETEGIGRIGELNQEMLCSQLAIKAAEVYNDNRARLLGCDKQVKTIAIINGGGGGDAGFVDLAKKMGADCFVTGDIKLHVAIHAEDSGLPLIEVGHHHLEQIYIKHFADILTNKIKQAGLKIAVHYN